MYIISTPGLSGPVNTNSYDEYLIIDSGSGAVCIVRDRTCFRADRRSGTFHSEAHREGCMACGGLQFVKSAWYVRQGGRYFQF